MKLSSVPVKKGISLFFLRCSVFLAAAGRLIRAACLRNSTLSV